MNKFEKRLKNWDRVKLNKLVEVDKESLNSNTPPDYEFSYVSLSDVNSGVINRALPLFKYVDAPSRARRKVKKGDILFSTVRPNLEGYARINTTVNNLVASTGFAVLSPKEISDTEFIYQYLYSYDIKKQIYSLVVGSNYPAVNSSDVANLKITISKSVIERKAIADLLSTWDEAIEKTERMIQAKEKRFKRLLNDLVYLPAREGKWKEVRTKSLFKERKETQREDLPLLSITNGEGVIPREDTNRKDTSNEDKSKYLRICPGDIGYNTMRMWQGVSALSPMEGIVSPAYTICIPGEKLHPLFVAYLFKMPFMIHRFYRYSQGLTSDTWNLKYPHFSEVKMPLPSIEEQERIADALSSTRQEIYLLKRLVEKYKTQKRGLMQKLLTGEWRIQSGKYE